MNALVAGSLNSSDPSEDEDLPLEGEVKQGWLLKKLSVRHKQIAALLAQGMKQVDIARLCDVTPQYVHMLLQQPLIRQHMQERAAAVGIRLDALFEQTVEVIANTLKDGSEAGKLKAARLQLEATKRIGPRDNASTQPVNTDEHLVRLSERLVALLDGHTNQPRGHLYENGEATEEGVILPDERGGSDEASGEEE